MEFQITMDPFMDFIFRMSIIGANIVVWTIIAQWLIIEIKSWFPDKKHSVDLDAPATRGELEAEKTKAIVDLNRLYNQDPTAFGPVFSDAINSGPLRLPDFQDDNLPDEMLEKLQAMHENNQEVFLDEVARRRH